MRIHIKGPTMSPYQFMGEHPFLTFFLAVIVSLLISSVLLAPFRAHRRWLRHLDLQKNGWPPPHLDADGDFKEED